ncbi:MAG: sucrose phosphorylase [Actinomycetes bacterium]
MSLLPDSPQLIAYADRLAGDLHGLKALLDGPLAGAFGGVHVLPFYPPIDGADAGFDPDDHTEVDPRLGTWDDVAALGRGRALMADLIVNHVSSRGPRFTDWSERGADSPYDGMFLTLDAVFPDGATEADLLTVYRPRPGLPLTPVRLADGRRVVLWTTFTSEQVDVDVTHPATRAYLTEILDRFEAAGVTHVRMDAVGYAVKTPGTSCFMTPETFDFVDELTAECRARGIRVLVEVHAHHERQAAIARKVDLVYDFALPPLVLHALLLHRADRLRAWLGVRPTNCVTVLDTHDGIGVMDVATDATDRTRPGLVPDEELDALVEEVHVRTGGASRRATGAAASNVDLYQVNTTYLDALGGDERLGLVARLLQVMVPGIPQVYYVGLLGLRNDVDLLERTGVGRDINRPHVDAVTRDAALHAPYAQRLLGLLRLRATHPAFAGSWSVADPTGAGPDDTVLSLRFDGVDGTSSVVLVVELTDASFELTVVDPDGRRRGVTDVADLADLA